MQNIHHRKSRRLVIPVIQNFPMYICISLLWNNAGTHKVLQLKSEFNLVADIRAASGFFYDDVKGATMNHTNQDAWASFCRVSPTHFDVRLCTDLFQVSPWCDEI